MFVRREFDQFLSPRSCLKGGTRAKGKSKKRAEAMEWPRVIGSGWKRLVIGDRRRGTERVQQSLLRKGGDAAMGYDDDDVGGALGFRLGVGYIDRICCWKKEMGTMVIDCGQEGWDTFVRENGVQEFDIVVFKHEGNMVFNTMVFDNIQSWCEREYSNNQVTESSRKCEIYNNGLSTKQFESHGMVATHFVGTLKQYTKSENRMHIPKKFALENGLSSGELILKSVGNEGCWTVKLSNCLGNNYRFQTGLKEFCTANGFKKGDTVKFELIQNGEKPVAILSRSEEGEMSANISFIPNDTPGSNSNNKSNPKCPILSTKQFGSHGMVETRCFVGVLKEYGDSRMHMYIPKKFAVENGLDSGELILKNVENEGSWTVDMRNRYGLEKGLKEFCIANGLEKGDAVKFELIQIPRKPVAILSSQKQHETTVQHVDTKTDVEEVMVMCSDDIKLLKCFHFASGFVN
ncbi:hypothetical protein QVD17_11853 [Tagetes erecta]|uniref:TF-B3 domain-containing protein n=1 Tax=Tagetes erecta TaxID=13708 RepID=A0AAD8KVX7_TARER|nr:hypothetical protein QVD17_11853 [Tagetes erecta]